MKLAPKVLERQAGDEQQSQDRHGRERGLARPLRGQAGAGRPVADARPCLLRDCVRKTARPEVYLVSSKLTVTRAVTSIWPGATLLSASAEAPPTSWITFWVMAPPQRLPHQAP